jgi:hypothetical protein
MLERFLMGAGLALSMAAGVCAESPLPVQVRVTHTAPDTWRVEYQFSQPVTALSFRPVGDYRKTSWKVLTPGVTLTTGAEEDALAATDGKPLRQISLEIATFDALVEKQYVAMDRFSDGGRAVYLGFLQGDVRQGAVQRDVAANFTLEGLGNEYVLTPASPADPSRGATPYAYFGPQAPVAAGDANIILDPKLPAWAVEAMLDATAKISSYYTSAYRQKLKQPLLLLVAAGDTEAPGLSIKGGAIGGQIAYRFGGAGLQTDHPKKRQLIARLVAHEMAHLWQNNVSRGGLSEQSPPWVHEGGADAMALDGLLRSGVWSAEQGQAYVEATLKECEQLEHSLATYRGIYACGFERYHKLNVGIVPLWRAMIAAAEDRGEFYSEAMISSYAAQGGKAAP